MSSRPAWGSSPLWRTVWAMHTVQAARLPPARQLRRQAAAAGALCVDERTDRWLLRVLARERGKAVELDALVAARRSATRRRPRDYEGEAPVQGESQTREAQTCLGSAILGFCLGSASLGFEPSVAYDAAMSSMMACLHGDDATRPADADCCGSSSTACRFFRKMSRRRAKTQKSHTHRDMP